VRPLRQGRCRHRGIAFGWRIRPARRRGAGGGTAIHSNQRLARGGPLVREIPFVDVRRLHAPLRDDLLGAFARVLDSGNYVQGREVAALEEEFAAATGAPFAVATSNGTTALQLALLSLGIGPGDEVITVANTFIATVEAISAVGATPVFAAIAPGSMNIDTADVGRKLTPNTAAIIPVHLYGELAPMAELMAIAHEHNIPVIEDA